MRGAAEHATHAECQARRCAYFIIDTEVTGPAGFAEYRKQVPGTVSKYGGKFLVHDRQMQALEGDWKARPCAESAPLAHAARERGPGRRRIRQRSGNPALRAPSTIRSNSFRNVGLSEYPDPSCASCSTVKPGRTLSSSATAAAASTFCPRQA